VRDGGRFRVRTRQPGRLDRLRALLHSLPAPPVARDVDQDPHQPGLGVRDAVGNRRRRPRRAEKRFLHEIPGVLGGPAEPAREPVQPLMVRVEKDTQPLGGSLSGSLGGGHCDGLPGHTTF
jgi:hypothetical protein